MVYSFELNRHGARHPTSIYNCTETFGFSMKDKGELNPIGVRQRYLIGKYNKL